MMAALHHRGPDDEGLVSSPANTLAGGRSAVLGMRRLSIIDLASGHQPVFNEEGSVAVVFNGEIYNFRELRNALQARGHVFRTNSDTEAIVHAYETWGEDCVLHFRGMFALAVLDSRPRPSSGIPRELQEARPRVFLARDRLGIKPLYYAMADGALLFASEVRALLASGRIAPRLSRGALESYLLFGSVAEPMTLVEGVFSLSPGHSLFLPVSDAVLKPRPKRYWSFVEAAQKGPRDIPRDLPAAARQLRPLLEEAVRSHLIADVPLGIFLSSGIDSTALAALASRVQKGMHSFTVVFPEQNFSEGKLARQTAETFGMQHQELLLGGEEMLARLEEAVSALDQPTMDGINTYFVSWAARQVGLKVALSGLGGDEIFGGYTTFTRLRYLSRLAATGRFVPRALRAWAAAAFVEFAARCGRSDAARKLAAIWHNQDGLPHAYFYARAVFPGSLAAPFLRSGDAAPSASLWRERLSASTRSAVSLGYLSSISCLEVENYLVNTLLRDTDAVSMHHSLEVRVPLLDHPLVEFVAQLPDSAKRRRGVLKALLVKALDDLLPAAVAHQPKRTFTFPWERWLRGAMRERIASELADLSPALQLWVKPEAVRAVWKDFLAGRTKWSRPWSLFVLNAWCRRHLDSQEAPVEPAPALAEKASARAS